MLPGELIVACGDRPCRLCAEAPLLCFSVSGRDPDGGDHFVTGHVFFEHVRPCSAGGAHEVGVWYIVEGDDDVIDVALVGTAEGPPLGPDAEPPTLDGLPWWREGRAIMGCAMPPDPSLLPDFGDGTHPLERAGVQIVARFVGPVACGEDHEPVHGESDSDARVLH